MSATTSTPSALGTWCLIRPEPPHSLAVDARPGGPASAAPPSSSSSAPTSSATRSSRAASCVPSCDPPARPPPAASPSPRRPRARRGGCCTRWRGRTVSTACSAYCARWPTSPTRCPPPPRSRATATGRGSATLPDAASAPSAPTCSGTTRGAEPRRGRRRRAHDAVGAQPRVRVPRDRAHVHGVRQRGARRRGLPPADRDRAADRGGGGQAGFRSLANFNRRFRELKGTTPRAWRARSASGAAIHQTTAEPMLCEHRACSGHKGSRNGDDDCHQTRPVRSRTGRAGTRSRRSAFDGGGWSTLDLDSHDDARRALANRSDAAVVSVDYRLSPEHPYPAGLQGLLDGDALGCRAFRADRGRGRQRRRQPGGRGRPATQGSSRRCSCSSTRRDARDAIERSAAALRRAFA